jgi:hypothetical protein
MMIGQRLRCDCREFGSHVNTHNPYGMIPCAPKVSKAPYLVAGFSFTFLGASALSIAHMAFVAADARVLAAPD